MLWPAWMAVSRLCFNRGGHGGVADTLGQVDAADAVALGGHGANLRLHGGGGQLAEGEAGRLRMGRRGVGDHGGIDLLGHLTMRACALT